MKAILYRKFVLINTCFFGYLSLSKTTLMNRSLFFFCIILFISSKLFSQAPPLQSSPAVAWEKQYGNGDGINDALINPDGTIIAVGGSGSNASVIKLDTAGNSLWAARQKTT